MKRYQDPKATLVFVLIAAGLMVLANIAFRGDTPVHEPMRVGPGEEERLYIHSEIADFELAAPASLKMPQEKLGPPEQYGPPVPIFKEMAGPFLPPPHRGEKSKIVIIIDDLGMDRRRTRSVMDLPAPITLAFLPYAPGLRELTEDAKAKGHELIIHVPMAPLNKQLNPGPLALKSDMNEEEFDIVLQKIFDSFDGYVGVNNHMGSKLTQDREAMEKVMAALAARKLLFVDSKTIGNSVAAEVAEEYGLAHAERDVFLDNEDSDASVARALRELEAVARKKGTAVAIGHPKDSTIRGLRNWIPGLGAKGFELVPASKVALKSSRAVPVLSSSQPEQAPLPPR